MARIARRAVARARLATGDKRCASSSCTYCMCNSPAHPHGCVVFFSILQRGGGAYYGNGGDRDEDDEDDGDDDGLDEDDGSSQGGDRCG